MTQKRKIEDICGVTSVVLDPNDRVGRESDY